MSTKKQRQAEQIKDPRRFLRAHDLEIILAWGRQRRHGENLLHLFPRATERDPIKLCKTLRRMEAKAQEIALRLCNGPEFPGGYDEVDALTGAILAKVNAILGNSGPDAVPIFVNRDPRGYGLKIDDDWMRKTGARLYSDWGGYGIIAPEITGD